MTMNDQNLEPAAEELGRAGKNNTNYLSDIPPLYSIAISLKRIADILERSRNLNIVAG